MQFSLAYFLYPTGHQFVFTSMQEPVIFFACFVSFCRDFGLLFLCFIIIGFLLPHQSESMEIIYRVVLATSYPYMGVAWEGWMMI